MTKEREIMEKKFKELAASMGFPEAEPPKPIIDKKGRVCPPYYGLALMDLQLKKDKMEGKI